MIERYGVYWVGLDPSMGSEMAKKRPAVIISDDQMNRHLATVVICPITTRIHEKWPSRVRTTVSGKEGEIAVDQIRTVAKRRLGERVGRIDQSTAEQLRHIITLMYGVLAG